MRFLLSLSILSILIFSLSCKTTTENQTQVSSSVQQEKEESQEKPQSIVVPVASLGDVSETRKKILQNSLEDELKEYFSIISQERFEEAQEKAFEQLDYEECTEDQCIMMIQEML
jgi:biopolymer transport protein ExbD